MCSMTCIQCRAGERAAGHCPAVLCGKAREPLAECNRDSAVLGTLPKMHYAERAESRQR